jgi:hypothetical protein
MWLNSDFHGYRQPDLRYPEGQHADLLGLLHQRDGHAHRCRPHPHCPQDLRQYDAAPIDQFTVVVSVQVILVGSDG